jgi:hypothetical protein
MSAKRKNVPNESGEVPINSLRLRQAGVTEMGLELVLVEHGTLSCRVKYPDGKIGRCAPSTLVRPVRRQLLFDL